MFSDVFPKNIVSSIHPAKGRSPIRNKMPCLSNATRGPGRPSQPEAQIRGTPRLLFFRVLIALCLSACNQAEPPVRPTLIAAPALVEPDRLNGTVHPPKDTPPTSTPAVTRQSPPTESLALAPDPISDPTPSQEPAAQICSPLEGIPIEALVEIISNPYEPSREGKDDGHPALDFAFYHWRSLKDIAGHPIQAVMKGSVAALGYDRLPYGNMVIIETNWEELPAAARQASGAEPDQSFYVLYAHLEEAPALTLGERVKCGQRIGLAGRTGRSGAPHLHLEARTGPADTIFSPMVFYDTQAQEDEIARYRLWTMSGMFTSVDPLSFMLPTDEP